MASKYILTIKAINCKLEFNFENYTYQDACCLYRYSDDKFDGLLSELTCKDDYKIFYDFKDYIHAAYDCNNGIESKYSRKHKELLEKINTYIESGGDDFVSVETV